MRNLNFIILGAQKAGTTTIASWLRQSKDIFIPVEKEIPFFLDDNYNKHGIDSFISEYFSKANNKQIIGKSSPQYMMYDYCFEKIKLTYPKIKLIIILRDPIDRMLSHYDMMKRFGYEKRNINEIIEDHLKNIKFYRNSKFDSETEKYIVAGEYDRIMENLYSKFLKSNILVIHFDEIKNNSLNTFNRILNFLEVDHVNSLNVQNIHMMKGGSESYFNHNKLISFLNRYLFINVFLPKLLIKKLRLLVYKLDQINIRPGSKTRIENINKSNLEKLRNHYSKTYKLIKKFKNNKFIA